MEKNQIDYKLFFIVLGLVIFGALMVSSVSVYNSYKITNSLVNRGEIDATYNYFYVARNIGHIVISMIMVYVVAKIPYKLFYRFNKYVIGLGLLVMIWVLLFGVEFNGSKGWIHLPGLTIQPVEFFKIALIIFLASYLKDHRDKTYQFIGGFVAFMTILISVVVLLGLQPDFGSILIIAPVLTAMFFIAGGRVSYLLALFMIGLVFVMGIYNIGKFDPSEGEEKNSFSYITLRIDSFLEDEKQAIADDSMQYQTKQGIIAIGSGGFSGLGFGKSIQKFGYLPEVEGDFIFSVIIEELGFIGGVVLFFAYGFIGYRGYLIALRSEDLFAKYFVFGFTTLVLTQASVNIGVNLNLIPLTGVTLPFISYGGSSMISLMGGMGIVLNISRFKEDEEMIRYKEGSKANKGNMPMYY